jgi:hypothetical protein
MTTKDFWTWFDQTAAPNLALREISFRKVFEYLDTVPGDITIVETGCTRQPGNWSGDGQSTILFDHYVQERSRKSRVYSVDINPESVRLCQGLVSPAVSVTAQDSVAYLNQLQINNINLLYLDSFDVDWINWYPSAAHHLKEIAAVRSKITPATMVVVDDCPRLSLLTTDINSQYNVVADHGVGGKGRLVAEFAQAVGARLEFSHYQAGWTGL